MSNEWIDIEDAWPSPGKVYETKVVKDGLSLRKERLEFQYGTWWIPDSLEKAMHKPTHYRSI